MPGLPVVFVGGPRDGLERCLTILPSVFRFRDNGFPGDLVEAEDGEIVYRRVPGTISRHHVYQYEPAQPA